MVLTSPAASSRVSKTAPRVSFYASDLISKSGAGEGIRTLDPNLGKVADRPRALTRTLRRSSDRCGKRRSVVLGPAPTALLRARPWRALCAARHSRRVPAAARPPCSLLGVRSRCAHADEVTEGMHRPVSPEFASSDYCSSCTYTSRQARSDELRQSVPKPSVACFRSASAATSLRLSDC